MDYQLVTNHIVDWLCAQLKESGLKGFVVGVSGGVDSAVVSTLGAWTNSPLICAQIPIDRDILTRANKHIDWLKENNPKNVESTVVDLFHSFHAFKKDIPRKFQTELAMVNLRSRLRMATLYSISNSMNYAVLGTGNKIEDNGVFFYTKYGDGAVDISPIGDLNKTEVFELGEYLGISSSILIATPSDDLWEDGRSDEYQLKATYPELEWAMGICDKLRINTVAVYRTLEHMIVLEKRQKEVLEIYLTMHEKGIHKARPIPVCMIPRDTF